MKKILIGAPAFLAAVLVVLLCLGLGLPAAGNLEPTAALDGDGTLWLAENQFWSSRLYGGDTEGRITQVYREARRDGGQTTAITHVAAGSRGVYFIRQTYTEGELSPKDWSLCRLSGGTGRIEELGGGAGLCAMQVTGLDVAYGEVLVAGVTAGRAAALCVLPETAADGWELRLQAGSDVISAAADGDGLMALLGDGRSVRLTGTAQLALDAYPEVELPEQVSVSFWGRVQCKAGALLLAVACVAALAVIVCLVRLGRRAKSLALRTTLVAGGCLLVTLIVVAVCLSVGGAALQAESALNYSASLAGARARLAGRADPASVLQDGFYGSQAAQSLAQTMAGGDELYALLPDGTCVALSDRFPNGSAAEMVLSADELALVTEAARGEAAEKLLYVHGRRLAVCAVPVNANGIPVAVLLSRSTAEISHGTLVEFVSSVGLTLGALFLIALVLLYLFLRVTARPIRALTDQMRRMSEGDRSVREIPDRQDELGEMGRAMQEMCMGLAIRDYEVDTVLRAYARFVPAGLDRLLDRASVMEISFGDARTITGSVGLFSVGNRERARAELADPGYVDFVSDCFGRLRESTEAHQGRLLYAGLDLARMPVFFPKAADAVQAGLDLTGELQRKRRSDGPAPDFFLMLHQAAFLYGIAGTQEQVFPFLSSSELEFLGGYADRFRAAGVHLVLTEPFLKQLGVGCNTRYIGFVASEDERFTYKLFEALDTYADLERNLRIRYDQRFQEGIQLFYRNDFYLARNIFSALLKACPRDGVVRWYLFACEHYFNSNPDQVDYRLFGIDQH